MIQTARKTLNAVNANDLFMHHFIVTGMGGVVSPLP